MLELLARQLNVDILVTGNTYECSAVEKNGRFFVDPGTATGSFSVSKEGPVTASFALLDVQADSVVTYLYRLLDDNIKVDRVVFKKSKNSSA
uniref:Vacuolar protein sorting-associated protein 29 n=1 Tax=Caenorhabditis japonica TaxID=281687 RepID=A0A8R1IB00_CAEJA